jgi:hypothetical protein
MNMVVVYAAKGPLAGRQVEIPEDQVKAATGEGGWAIEIKPGNQLLADPGAVYDPSWVIPGYTTEQLEPFSGKKSAQQEKPTKEPGNGNGQRSESSSKTTGARTASEREGGDDD